MFFSSRRPTAADFMLMKGLSYFESFLHGKYKSLGKYLALLQNRRSFLESSVHPDYFGGTPREVVSAAAAAAKRTSSTTVTPKQRKPLHSPKIVASKYLVTAADEAERRNGNSDDRWISIWSEVNNKWFYYHEAFKYGQWEKPDDYPRPPPFVRDSCTQTDLRRIEQKVIAKPPSSTSSSKSSIGGERKKKNDGTNTTLNNTVHVVEDNDSGSDESGSDGSKKSSPRLFSSSASSTSSTSSNTSSTSSTFSTSSRKRSLGGKETTKQSTKTSSQQQRKKMRKGGAGKQRSSSATKSREGGSRFEKCFMCNQDILKSKGLQAHIREKHPELMF